MTLVFLSHFDGVDAATSATDESDSAHNITFVGDAQLDTAQKRFGTASLLLDGTGDFVSMADSVDWAFAGGQFTVEGLFRFPSVPTTKTHLIGQWDAAANQRSWQLFYDGSTNKLEVLISSNGSESTVRISSSFTPTVDVWHTLAMDKDSSGKYRLYVDGVMIGSASAIENLLNSTGLATIGAKPDAGFPFNGHIDEVRIIKGIAQYASDSGYTIATSEFIPGRNRITQLAVETITSVVSKTRITQLAVEVIMENVILVTSKRRTVMVIMS